MCVSTVPEAGDLWPSCCVVLWYHTEKGQKRRKRREKGWKWEMDGRMGSHGAFLWWAKPHVNGTAPFMKVCPSLPRHLLKGPPLRLHWVLHFQHGDHGVWGQGGEGVHPNHVEGLGVWGWNFVINLFPMAWVPWEWTGSQKNQGLKSILQNLLSFQI